MGCRQDEATDLATVESEAIPEVIEAVQSSPWGWTPATITLLAYGTLVALGIGRLVAMWLDGWRTYSHKKTVWAFNVSSSEFSRNAMCARHQAEFDGSPNPPPSNTQCRRDLAVRPCIVGTRHWSYKVVRGDPLGWFGWTLACARHALVRRFRDPDIRECWDCSVTATTALT